MKRHALHLALRETYAFYARPRGRAVMAVVGLAAGFVGPFGTFVSAPFGLRLVYWLMVAFATGGAGVFGGTLAGVLAHGRALARPIYVLWVALGAAVPVTAALLFINLLFGGTALAFGDAAMLGLYAFGIALAVTAIADLMMPAAIRSARSDKALNQAQERPAGVSPAPPPILKRLPAAKRGPLVRLSTADHYVEVHTQAGMALVLMRFSDALAETGDVAGFQIHRSHWVALAAVSELAREGEKTIVVLTDATRLPVARGKRADLRKALDAHTV